MGDEERSTPETPGEQPAYDRRRGPRRNTKESISDDRRQVDRRKTPGIPKLLDDILNSPFGDEVPGDET